MIYDRILFGTAALWNLVAAAMLLWRPEAQLERMRIADPAAIWLARSFVSSVATWGIAYGMIAFDPLRFRDFAWLGVISKLLYFSINAVAFQQGRLTREAFLPALIDLLLAILFFEYLWRTSGR
ncbi:MAG: hypothetical protein ACKOB4_04450 [Acidobacteriota bacterium]